MQSVLCKLPRYRVCPEPCWCCVCDVAIVRDGNLVVETSGFPKNCKVALPASTNKAMERLSINFASCNTSKTSRYWVPTEGLSGASYLPQLKTQRQYNEPLEVRRRLTRIVTSYCDPLKWAMRNQGPKRLMKIIRDAMIVYYEAYKRPEHGFIHGGKRFLNDFVY